MLQTKCYYLIQEEALTVNIKKGSPVHNSDDLLKQFVYNHKPRKVPIPSITESPVRALHVLSLGMLSFSAWTRAVY